jgi:hypothetical protein
MARRERDRAGDRTAVDDEGDVDGPVVSFEFSELTSPVEWVNDPHPTGSQPGGVGDSLFGQNRVFGHPPPESIDDEVVGALVALSPQGLRIAGEVLAELKQQLTGLFGHDPRDVVISCAHGPDRSRCLAPVGTAAETAR